MVITITPIGCCVALKIAKKMFISAHQSIPECFYQCIGGRWMDGRIAHNLPFAILPTFPFCHFASCPLMQMVNLGPKCALSNYNFLIGLQIKSAPQTIMGKQSQMIHYDRASPYCNKTRIDMAIAAPKFWIFEQDS